MGIHYLSVYLEFSTNKIIDAANTIILMQLHVSTDHCM